MQTDKTFKGGLGNVVRAGFALVGQESHGGGERVVPSRASSGRQLHQVWGRIQGFLLFQSKLSRRVAKMQKPLSSFCLFIHFSWDIFLMFKLRSTWTDGVQIKYYYYCIKKKQISLLASIRNIQTVSLWLHFVNIFIGFLLQVHDAPPPPQLQSTSNCSTLRGRSEPGRSCRTRMHSRVHPFESVFVGCTEVTY